MAGEASKLMQLDPDTQAFLARAAASGVPPYETLSAVAARGFYKAGRALVAAPPEHVAGLRSLSAPGPNGPIGLRCYRPESPAKLLPILVYLHGGGWVLGDLDSHDSVCRALANRSGHLVISVDYRLAPEHPFPAGLEDAYAAVCWIADNARQLGGDAARLAVGGDSAGGNLSAVICLRARDEDGPQIAFQLLIYPATDFEMKSASQRTFAEGYLLTRANQLWFHRLYLGGRQDLTDWRLSPAHAADHSRLPPAYVLTAQFDPLRDEGEDYAAKLLRSGVPVGAWRIAGQIHGFITMGGLIKAAHVAIDELGRALKDSNR
jgi:acetyl esterase